MGSSSGARSMEGCIVSEKQTQAGLVQQHRELAELQAAVGQFLTTFAMVESLLQNEIQRDL
jgi:hypothetical protein